MDTLFGYLFAGWGVGMVGYVYVTKISRYKKMKYYDVTNKLKKFKKAKDKLNTNNTSGKIFK